MTEDAPNQPIYSSTLLTKCPFGSALALSITNSKTLSKSFELPIWLQIERRIVQQLGRDDGGERKGGCGEERVGWPCSLSPMACSLRDADHHLGRAGQGAISLAAVSTAWTALVPADGRVDVSRPFEVSCSNVKTAFERSTALMCLFVLEGLPGSELRSSAVLRHLGVSDHSCPLAFVENEAMSGIVKFGTSLAAGIVRPALPCSPDPTDVHGPVEVLDVEATSTSPKNTCQNGVSCPNPEVLPPGVSDFFITLTTLVAILRKRMSAPVQAYLLIVSARLRMRYGYIVQPQSMDSHLSSTISLLEGETQGRDGVDAWREDSDIVLSPEIDSSPRRMLPAVYIWVKFCHELDLQESATPIPPLRLRHNSMTIHWGAVAIATVCFDLVDDCELQLGTRCASKPAGGLGDLGDDAQVFRCIPGDVGDKDISIKTMHAGVLIAWIGLGLRGGTWSSAVVWRRSRGCGVARYVQDKRASCYGGIRYRRILRRQLTPCSCYYDVKPFHYSVPGDMFSGFPFRRECRFQNLGTSALNRKMHAMGVVRRFTIESVCKASDSDNQLPPHQDAYNCEHVHLFADSVSGEGTETVSFILPVRSWTRVIASSGDACRGRLPLSSDA
ncbi:hypothetical protein OBBRIDRAFT_805897 [Obba rivulosa]|uniref:Uncharacterized protein n=1 Tax=Obba rivulosa TaxID=1052685 RepID=A0A8E2DH08_9APHY|nr:hypothetical protein OBBRIDRAFT_805897 [Obba rivulosa]